MTTLIQTLRPNVSQDQALCKFSSVGPGALYRRVRLGPLRRVADVYVPFFLYRATYELGRRSQTRLFAIDAVAGSLDLFEFPHAPDGEQLVTLQTRNNLTPALTERRASELLRGKILRIIFQQGFFKLRECNLECCQVPLDLHLPYWLAFYGEQTARCRVIDAVRRRFEGAKACAFFEEWLAA